MTTKKTIARIVFWAACAVSAAFVLIGAVQVLLHPALILACIVGLGLAFAIAWSEENK